jgi:hypothetical protein
MWNAKPRGNFSCLFNGIAGIGIIMMLAMVLLFMPRSFARGIIELVILLVGVAIAMTIFFRLMCFLLRLFVGSKKEKKPGNEPRKWDG